MTEGFYSQRQPHLSGLTVPVTSQPRMSWEQGLSSDYYQPETQQQRPRVASMNNNNSQAFSRMAQSLVVNQGDGGGYHNIAMEDNLTSDLASATSEPPTYYQPKLRPGKRVADLRGLYRDDYQEQPPQDNGGRHTQPPQDNGGRHTQPPQDNGGWHTERPVNSTASQNHGQMSNNEDSQKRRSYIQDYDRSGGRKAMGYGGGQHLYRSTSDLNLNTGDGVGSQGLLPGSLRREYGSTDVLEKSHKKEAFRTKHQPYGYKDYAVMPGASHNGADRRTGRNFPDGQRVPQLHPQGGMVRPFSSGIAGNDSSGNSDSSPSNTALKNGKAKRQNAVGKKAGKSSGGEHNFLKRLRSGGKTESALPDMLPGYGSNADASGKNESQANGPNLLSSDERNRLKGVIHYDCQSIGFTLTEAQSESDFKMSKMNGDAEMSSGDVGDSGSLLSSSDESAQGSLRRNSLVDPYPAYQNEIGGEEERNVALTMVTAQRKVKQLLGHSKCLGSVFRPEMCNGVSVLEFSSSSNGPMLSESVLHHGPYILESVDRGTSYYRQFFKDYEHVNYFGMDDNYGPIAISIKREKVSHMNSLHEIRSVEATYLSRIIVRSSQPRTLRGLVHDNVIPSSSSSSNSSSSSGTRSNAKGVSHKDIIEFICPGIQTSCLKVGISDEKTHESLMKVDEQHMNKTYKFGVLLCLQGQGTEEEMYNNQHSTPAFIDFLHLLGQTVRLKDFKGYKGGLDTKSDTTGSHSVYTTCADSEVMFHVSTLLPFTDTNPQQLLRKRHIGNDFVTVVFQEPEAKPFTPATIRSQFQRVFIVVRVNNPGAEKVTYSVSVVRSKHVPPFGPIIPADGTFESSQEFGQFLIAKMINAENAVYRSDKFVHLAVRTKREYLKDLATNCVTMTTLDPSKISKLLQAVGPNKKKKSALIPHVPPNHLTKGAIVWTIMLEDFGQSAVVQAYLGISSDTLVVIEKETREVVFTTQCYTIIGWSPSTSSLRLFYNQGECIYFQVEVPSDILEIVKRLSCITQGCETSEIILRRNNTGQLGFHVHHEGIVSDVEKGHAWEVGLRAGSRLVEICKVSTATLTHDQMIDLLRTSAVVSVVVIPPFENGKPRKGLSERFKDLYAPYPNDTLQVEPTSVKRISVQNTAGSSLQGVTFRKVGSAANNLSDAANVPEVKRSGTEPSFTNRYSFLNATRNELPASGRPGDGGVEPPRNATVTYWNGASGSHERTSSRDSGDSQPHEPSKAPTWQSQGGPLYVPSAGSSAQWPNQTTAYDPEKTQRWNPVTFEGGHRSSGQSGSSHRGSAQGGGSFDGGTDMAYWGERMGSSFDSSSNERGQRKPQFYGSVRKGRAKDQGPYDNKYSFENLAARSKSETHLNMVSSRDPTRDPTRDARGLLLLDSEEESELFMGPQRSPRTPPPKTMTYRPPVDNRGPHGEDIQKTWSQLVDVASKALDGDESSGPPSDTASTPTKKVVSYGEQEKSRELERKLQYMEEQMAKDRKKIAELSNLFSQESRKTAELSNRLQTERDITTALRKDLQESREDNSKLQSKLDGFTHSFFKALDNRDGNK